jgi:hypothetical protein
MPTLPDKSTDEGLEARVLLAECRSPSFSGYSLASAKTCMQFMDLVLWNRVRDPKPYLAKEGTLRAVVTAKGQYAGFEMYPNYNNGIRRNIQDQLDIANSSKDKRSTDFSAHVQAALDVVNSPTTIPEPSSGTLAAWRTAGSGSPGAGFTLFRTVLNTDFYFR